MATSTDTAPSLSRRFGGFVARHARGLAALTLAATFFLVLLGEFTAAVGAGATCNNTYPGCAGHLSPVGLSVPQFIEWFHRLAAMTTGYLIVGTALAAWWTHRGTSASRSAWLAALLLPLQVVFGGVTVTLAGLVPGGYAPPAQLSHFTTALAIFTALVAATVWLDIAEGRGASARRLRYAALAAVVLPVLQAVFARGLFVVFWPSIQTAYHFFGLLAFAVLVTAALWARERGETDAALLAVLGAALTLVNAFLIIGLFVITQRVVAVSYLLLALQFLVGVAFAWTCRRSDADAGADPVVAD